MRKEWMEASVEILNVAETAYGEFCPENPDSDKTQVFDPERGWGWQQEFGENPVSVSL